MKPKGWKHESARHSLAAKGVKTGRRKKSGRRDLTVTDIAIGAAKDLEFGVGQAADLLFAKGQAMGYSDATYEYMAEDTFDTVLAASRGEQELSPEMKKVFDERKLKEFRDAYAKTPRKLETEFKTGLIVGMKIKAGDTITAREIDIMMKSGASEATKRKVLEHYRSQSR